MFSVAALLLLGSLATRHLQSRIDHRAEDGQRMQGRWLARSAAAAAPIGIYRVETAAGPATIWVRGQGPARRVEVQMDSGWARVEGAGPVRWTGGE
jgi:hypothetical protein